MHKEGQDSGLLLGWLGLKRLGVQAVTEGRLLSIRHEGPRRISDPLSLVSGISDTFSPKIFKD